MQLQISIIKGIVYLKAQFTNPASGEYVNHGYLPEIEVYTQGLDANAAYRTVVGTTYVLGIALNIGFMWHPKKGVAHPGERARLSIPEKSQSGYSISAA